jgi:4-hydroxy-tetrahydrodipicolinate synthase
MNFGNVLTAMVTPFDDNLEVNYIEAKRLAQYLVDNGSDGIVVAGTTGESPTLTKDEKLRLFAVVKEQVGDSAKVIAGTGSNNTKECISLTREAEKLGVDGIMLVVPYYNKPCQEGLFTHFHAIATATTLPVMLYNVPTRTVTNLNPDTVAKLAAIPNIVAIKESAGSMDQVTELRRVVPEDFVIYSGDDSLTLPMLALGCHGVVSVAAHIAGEEIQAMVKAFKDGDHAKATAIQVQLFPIFKSMFVTSNPVPVKAAVNLLGIKAGSVRLPLLEAKPEVVEAVRRSLVQLGRL